MLRRLLFILTIAILYSPFGLDVQAETTKNENQTVNEMLSDQVTNDSNKKTEKETVQVEKEKTQIQTLEQNLPENEPLEFESTFTWFDFVKMFFALAVVIALIYGILRFLNQRNRLFGQMRAMENLGGIGLGTNRSIQLIRIGDRVLVVGVGETIQLLKEITSQEEIEHLINQGQVSHVGQSFLNNLRFGNDTQQSSSHSSQSFNSLLKGQLDELAEGRKKVYDKYKRNQDE